MSRGGPKVSSQIIPLFLRALKRRGIAPGLELELMEQPTLDRVTEEVGRLLKTEFPALHVLLEESRGEFGMLEFLIRSADTLREASQLLARFGSLLGEALEFKAEDVPEGLALHLRVPGEPQGLGRHGNEFIVGKLVLFGRELLGRRWAAGRVWFSHPSPSQTEPLALHFGVEPKFDQPTSGLLIPGPILDVPTVSRDPNLKRTILHELTRRLPPQEPNSFHKRVETLMFRQLEQQRDVTLEWVGQSLHMSARTLQRKLEERGITFKGMTEDVRGRMAEDLLKDPQLTMGEVSFRLGYSDTSAFVRAFRRWMGMTPGELRRSRMQEEAAPGVGKKAR